jgi:nitrite reductase/ring-hydroxylating ferredoxin subunit
VRIGRTTDIGAGKLRRYEVGEAALCVAHIAGDGFYAVEDRCSHENVELSDGDLVGHEIECPLHGSLFDVRTGEVCGLPAERPVRVCQVTVVGDDLMVELEDTQLLSSQRGSDP